MDKTNQSTSTSGGEEPKISDIELNETLKSLNNILFEMQDKFQVLSEEICRRIEEMGSRINDLEGTISNMMEQAEELEHIGTQLTSSIDGDQQASSQQQQQQPKSNTEMNSELDRTSSNNEPKN